jgi:hypothetical protein
MNLLSAGGARSKGPTILVLAPTRELAMQSEEVCRAAGGVAGVASICIYGGVPKWPQKQAIAQGAKVVVATPGRLLDLEQEGAIDLSGVSYLVLDEADRMLDMGFEKDVRAIISLTNTVRQPTGKAPRLHHPRETCTRTLAGVRCPLAAPHVGATHRRSLLVYALPRLAGASHAHVHGHVA